MRHWVGKLPPGPLHWQACRPLRLLRKPRLCLDSDKIGLKAGFSGPDESLGPVLESSSSLRSPLLCGEGECSNDMSLSFLPGSSSPSPQAYQVGSVLLHCWEAGMASALAVSQGTQEAKRSSAEVPNEVNNLPISSLLTQGVSASSHALWTGATEVSQELDLSPSEQKKEQL